MEENEFWGVHAFYLELSQYEDIDLEGTEYMEHGTFPKDVHDTVSDHKEAIRLITKVLEEESSIPVEELETWHKEYDDYNQYAGRFGVVD